MADELLSSKELAARRQRGVQLLRLASEARADRLRIGVLSSFNLEFLPPLLAEACDRVELPVDVQVGPFGQISQETLAADSSLYGFNPKVVVIVPAAEDVLAPLFQEPAKLEEADRDLLVERRIAELSASVASIGRYCSAAQVLLVDMGYDRAPCPYVLSTVASERGERELERFRAGLRSLGEAQSFVSIVDWEATAKEIGRGRLRDERLWYLARMRLGTAGAALLSDLIAEHLYALFGRPRKVLAVDFDNTLWGGVVGEVGISGLQLGNEGVGLAFQDVQRELLKLRELGYVLVACSKNNPDDAMPVFEHHHGMILKKEHFAAWRVNWNDKAANLQEMADELNVGVDSFVFLDDNRVERDWVRAALPAVLTPELPADPVRWPGFLASVPQLRRMEVTDADRRRVASYAAANKRNELREHVQSLDEFLATLNQEVTLTRLNGDGPAMARAAQMCQRTNQFNLSTRRHTPADLQRLARDDGTEITLLSVRDRFEDSGIVGLAIVAHNGEQAELDTLLMSCRVLGRKLEDAFMAQLAARSRGRGAQRLVAPFVDSGKNRQVSDFLVRIGFAPGNENRYVLNLESKTIACPDFVKVIRDEH